ncbi:GGDEF domain-containing protein [Psychromonas sp. KJ10-10]|uniref:GGDEF domain-containing protein n=1 Tax=Psychromonas sp. KJ10-10 TaxID=3391823 RepID=UPI0039B512F5
MAFRLGGDEFTLILQPGDQHSVDSINERLAVEISNTNFLTELNFSVSVGYAHWQMGEDVNSLFAIADKKLYRNKKHK